MKKLDRQSTGIPCHRPVRVLQFGEGNFLRAFMDWMIDVLNEKTEFNGDVQIIQPIKTGMADLINQQDGMYHVVLRGVQQGKLISDARLISCVRGVLNPYADFQGFLSLAENPDLKFIVSNTTEAGILFDPGDTSPKTLPNSFPGKLTLLLYHRFRHFNGASDKGVILLPCELIEKNGEALRQAALDYSTHWNLSSEFSNWIEQSNTFCSTLVDRIVPGFPKENIKEIQEGIGYNDSLVVTAEPFHLWVIEAAGAIQKLLPTAQAGLQVKFVNDLTPYRTRKVRILNGAHTALVPVAYLRGLRTVKDSIDDLVTGEFIRKAVFEEIIPTLDLPQEELHQFANQVIERFQNPFIRHELISIALNSISKYKVRVLPSVLEYHTRTGRLPERLLYSLAALIRFYKGEWQGESIPLNDTPEVISFFKRIWSTQNLSKIVTETLSNKEFWGIDLNRIEGLTASLLGNLTVLENSEERQ